MSSQTPAQTDTTPLMKQYWEQKKLAPDALLLFRMGDFYELFDQDAVTASQLLDITLTSRDKNKENPMPMAGVPHHSAQGYIQRLLEAGKKVAICEQVEDPSTAKGIVRREIVRVFTPAIQFEGLSAESQYLGMVVCLEEKWGLGLLDPTTGETLWGEKENPQDWTETFQALKVKHLLYFGFHPPEKLLENLRHFPEILLESLPENFLTQDQASHLLKTHYGLASLDLFFPVPTAVFGIAGLIHYTLKTQHQEKLGHLQLPQPLERPQRLIYGPKTPWHLDLISQDSSQPSLFGFLNRTKTALGARTLKRWLLQPSIDPQEIALRQNAIQELNEYSVALQKITQVLSEVYDLERLAARVTTRLASPKDTLALGRTLSLLPNLGHQLSPFESPVLVEIHQALNDFYRELRPLADRIIHTQKDDPPWNAKEGGIFKKGLSSELDRLLKLTEEGEQWLIELEQRERQATQIPSLKVRYNRVFGYYIEVTKTHLKNVPDHYARKQSMANAERFITAELKEFEEQILTASTKQKALEQSLFEELLETIQQNMPTFLACAKRLADLDCLGSLAQLADETGWGFPKIDNTLDLEITDGRHPLVESYLGGEFVPNDLELGASKPHSTGRPLTLMITGPNMGGKSTMMRQVALIVILGQMGAPVPARESRWGVFSSIYTRIGAQDAITRGQSTFMVEMTELAHILHRADERSLIILDEIGRGTSTFDGMSVAWASLEWICSRVRSRTLFATHYHELTQLQSRLPALANAHMAVDSSTENPLRFLYKLRKGPANESYGIQVAQLAGLPRPVIQRAWKVLEELEAHTPHPSSSDEDFRQLSFLGLSSESQETTLPLPIPFLENEAPLETPLETPVLSSQIGLRILDEMAQTDVNQLTPLAALNLLHRWKNEVQNGQ